MKLWIIAKQMKKKQISGVWLSVLALVLGAIFALFVSSHLNVALLPIGSKRFFVFIVFLVFLGAIIYRYTLKWGMKQFAFLSKKEQYTVIFLTLLIGPTLFFTTTSQWLDANSYVDFLLPVHKFDVSLSPEEETGAVFLTWFSTSFGNIPFEEIRYFSEDSFYWEGRPGEEIAIIVGTQGSDRFFFSWDGQGENISLDSSLGEKFVFTRELHVPWFATREAGYIIGSIFFSTIILFSLLGVWSKRFEWLHEFENEIVSNKEFSFQNNEWIIVFFLFVFTFCIRLINIEGLPPHLEEYNHLNAAKNLLNGAHLKDVYQRGLYLVTFPVKAFFTIFGIYVWSARLPGIILNSLAIIPLYFLGRKINKNIALLSSALYITSPWVIALSRSVREYAYHPFFFYLILLGLIAFLNDFPEKVIVSEWKAIFTPKRIMLAFIISLPLVFAIAIDPFSTFKVIALPYFVFFMFLVAKFDLKAKENILFGLTLFIAGVLLFVIYFRTLSVIEMEIFLGSLTLAEPLRNLGNNNAFILLSQFFFNPPVQWYYDRILLLPILSIILTYFWSMRIKKKNFIPLFIAVLYFLSLILFVLLFDFDYAPRFFLHMQLWYILLLAMGLYSLYHLSKSFIKNDLFRNTLFLLVFFGVFNLKQITVHTSDTRSAITYSAHIGFEEINGFLIQNVTPNDVLISKYYGRYAKFTEYPRYAKIYEASFDAEAIDDNDSGWIVVENTRHWYVEEKLPLETFLHDDVKIEYIGEFQDRSGFSNYLWYWNKLPTP